MLRIPPFSVRRHPAARLALLLGGAGVGALAVLGTSVVFVRRKAAGHLYAESEAPPAPVALVLGAQVYPSGAPSSFLAARLDLARRLLAAGTVRVLLLSGDGGAPEYDEPAAMRAYLVAAGVPAERLVLDRFGLDTYDSAFRARRVFGVEHLLVVSQTYHLPRAVATCRALGIRADGVGDFSVRRLSPAWVKGVLRDQVACVKTLLDLGTRRRPVLGPAQHAVLEALTGTS
jgi:vancomycin permeability regulator SanA